MIMKKLCSIGLTILIMLICAFSVNAAEQTLPYYNYTFAADGSVITSPQAYVPDAVIFGHDLGIGDFSNAADMDSDKEGNLYILDVDNCRVVVLDNNYKLLNNFSLKTTLKDGTEIALNEAKGITVTEDKIYICDTGNSRVLVFSKDNGKYIKMITTPKSKALDENFIFKPAKASIDSEGNYYIVSEGTFEGVLNLDANGEFLGFFATNEAVASAWDLFWRRFSSIEQRKTSIQFIPQDFSSIDIDSMGFFFITTSVAQNNSMIKRVNPGGNDIIRNVTSLSLIGDISGYTQGDNAGKSSFIDVSSGPYKICACLDITRGKIFCYSTDGYLLYTFGALSDQKGGFTAPNAITYLSDQKIAVLDNRTNSVTVFTPTEYAKIINKGIEYSNNLEYDKALVEWENILKINNNNKLAQEMIAKSYYADGKYDIAMKYFKSAGNKEMYSTVKETVRKEWIFNNAKYIIIAVILLVVLGFARGLFKKIKNAKKAK